MTHIRSSGVASWLIAVCVLMCSASDALALKYVIPYPKEKRDAARFKVTEEKDGTLEFEVTIDEKKLGQQVVDFEISAYAKSERGQRRGVTFSAKTTRTKDGQLLARFAMDRELSALATAEFAVAPFPGEGKDVPGGTFLAFQLRDFVDLSPEVKLHADAESLTPETRKRIADYERAYREQTRVGSEKNSAPKVRPVPRNE